MANRIVVIVQARMGSERLPGKVMRLVLGKPLLAYVISQLRRVSQATELVIATSTSPLEQPIVDLCQQLGVPCFRGSLDDVLARYLGAAEAYRADTVVRICADCPLIDPAVVDQVIGYYLQNSERFDYVTNGLKRTFPRGQDTEVFSRAVLDDIARAARAPEEREHVTPYIYRHPERFRLGNVEGAPDLSAHRWVVDTPEDFAFVTKVLEALYPTCPNYGMNDILRLLERHPDWLKINAHIQQKGLTS